MIILILALIAAGFALGYWLGGELSSHSWATTAGLKDVKVIFHGNKYKVLEVKEDNK